MRLKLLKRSITTPDGKVQTTAAIVHEGTGEAVEGLIGFGILIENGVQFLQLRTTQYSEAAAGEPQIAIASQIPRVANGR